MAEGFRIEASWLDALDNYVEGLKADAASAAESAAEITHDAVISYARSKPAWVGLADSIQKWSADGRLMIGFLGNEMASQAEALEYGDLTNPPDSLFRTLDHIAVLAQEHFNTAMQARRPIVIPGVKV